MVKMEKGIWAFFVVVLLAVCMTWIMADVSPALRTYCLRVEDASQADIWSDCVVFDVTGTRMCLDKNCDCDCDDTGEGWISQDDCSSSNAVAVFDSSLEQFFCSGNMTFSSNTLKITNGAGQPQLNLTNNGAVACTLTTDAGGALNMACSGAYATVADKLYVATTATPQLTIYNVAETCAWSVDGSGVLTLDCSGDSVIFSDPVTFSSGALGTACEDTQTGVLQFSDGSSNLTCKDELYTLPGTNLYMHDQSAATEDDKQILISVSASTGGSGDDTGTGYIGFTDATPAAPTELVNSFDFKSEGTLHFEPCCTTAEFGADCKYPQSACVLAATGMDVVGELNVKSDLTVDSDIYVHGTVIPFSPLKLRGPVELQDSTGAVKTTMTTDLASGGDFDITPDGGSMTVTGDLTVTSTFSAAGLTSTISGQSLTLGAGTATDICLNFDIDTADETICWDDSESGFTPSKKWTYADGDQTIIENRDYATPSTIKYVAATDLYQVYTLGGLDVRGFVGAVGPNESRFAVTASGTTTITSSATTNVIAGSATNAVTLDGTGFISIKETASAPSNFAGFGRIWVKNTTPSTLWTRDDAANDYELGKKAHGSISAADNATQTTISVASTPVQVTVFDTDDSEYIDDADHTNDHIAISVAGTYLINASFTINSIAGAASRCQITVLKNNGASAVCNLQVHRNLAGGSGESGVGSISGICALSASDTVELWVENETNTQNYVFEDVTLSAVRLL